jgi:Uncharacterised ACR (DUF711)
MQTKKIIRTICYFTSNPSKEHVSKIESIANDLAANGYFIQTKRICSPPENNNLLIKLLNSSLVGYANNGTLSYDEAISIYDKFIKTTNLSFNLDLTLSKITDKFSKFLFRIIEDKPSKTFDFAFTFNNPHSSPYFPSSKYEKDGFAIGLQPTNLAQDCNSLEEWFDEMQKCWQEISDMFADKEDFLGIDSSIAPYQSGDGSLIYLIKRISQSFTHSTTTDIYTRITEFIKNKNPKPIGLCGLMFPCLEDIDLAQEYDAGNFSIERNIYLSLHSGLGIDTYPVGIDENGERVIEILKLVQSLSCKYQKPLSVRFVSDGRARIGEKTNFGHEHLTNCTIRAL